MNTSTWKSLPMFLLTNFLKMTTIQDLIMTVTIICSHVLSKWRREEVEKNSDWRDYGVFTGDYSVIRNCLRTKTFRTVVTWEGVQVYTTEQTWLSRYSHDTWWSFTEQLWRTRGSKLLGVHYFNFSSTVFELRPSGTRGLWLFQSGDRNM